MTWVIVGVLAALAGILGLRVAKAGAIRTAKLLLLLFLFGLVLLVAVGVYAAAHHAGP